MPDDNSGFSSDDMIRQARERFQIPDDEETSVSEDMAREAAEAFDNPVDEVERSPASPPSAPEPPESRFTEDELRMLAERTRPTEAAPPPLRPQDFGMAPTPTGRPLPQGPVEDYGDDDDDINEGRIFVQDDVPQPAQKTTRGPIILALVALVLGGFIAIGLVASTSTSATDLSIGECLLEPSGEEFTTVQTVDCSEPHDYEIFALTSIPGEAYPGDFEIFDVAFERCEPHFELYVGREYELSKYYIDVFVPGPEAWNDGDREVRCALFEPGDNLESIQRVTGTARRSSL